MALKSGSRLGPYEIISLIGTGGMGEVYKAKDTRLDRTIAIKVLPSHLSDNAERRERFEREARAVSSLNHPHICTLHDVGEQDGTYFLVMEYMEGETLADRLKKGPLPLEEALRYSTEIADALDKAHRQSVVHRDLKPGNIMLTKPGAKLLDFGLAKFRPSAQENQALSALPTEEKPLTEKGAILGTFQYMAPEQLEGREVDSRTDIFAFGAVLYEMVTGKRAFEGKSQASLIGAIMNSDPPALSSLQPMTPPALEHVVKTCLAKDPDDRWQTATDVMLELRWVAEKDTDASPAVEKTRGWRQTVPHVATAIAVGLVVALIAWILLRPGPQGIARFTIDPTPAEEFFHSDNYPGIAISPDGSQIVFVGQQVGVQQLYLRPMSQLEATPLANTEGANYPFFSPDGQWLGFVANGNLKKISLRGGASITLCGVSVSGFRGASWGADDRIVFAGTALSGLSIISAAGGKPRDLTRVDPQAGESSHRWPQILPGGKAVLFTEGNLSRDWETSRIVVRRLDTGEQRLVIEGGTFGRYLPTGHILYSKAGTLMATRFNLDRLEAEGTPVPVLEGVGHSVQSGFVDCVFSDSGSFAYIPRQQSERRLAWVDRKGVREAIPAPPRAYLNPRLSRDGRSIAVAIEELRHDLWIYDLIRGTLSRLTFEARNYSPEWSSDGKRVAFSSTRMGGLNLFWKPVDGSSLVEPLAESEHFMHASSWAADGQALAYEVNHPVTGRDIWLFHFQERQSRPYLETQFDEGMAMFSPDGRWMAFESNESGRYEIYLGRYPGTGERRQISSDGGSGPLWSRNGKEIFFRNGPRMMVVNVETEGKLTLGQPRLLFENLTLRQVYDVSPDSQRFITIEEGEPQSAPTQLILVQNWFEELKRIVPIND